VPDGATQSDEALAAIAREKGTVELLRFWQGEPLERIVTRLGDPGYGCPGFTSMNRAEAEKAVAAGLGIVLKDGKSTATATLGTATVEWRFPKSVGMDTFETIVYLDGKPAYTETRHEALDLKSGAARPAIIRVNYETGEAIIQVFEYNAPTPAEIEDPYADFGDAPSKIVSQSSTLDPGKAVSTGGVHFRASHGLVIEYDSGFWPGGGSSPGAFPIQVRFAFGAAWNRGAEVDGTMFLDNTVNGNALTLGQANGRWWIDYGVELIAQGAYSLPIIGSHTFDLPYIPNFDYRIEREATFTDWLLNGGAGFGYESPRYRLFNLDIVSLIVGTSIPGLAAGARLDGTLGVEAELRANSISLSDGNQFYYPWQTIPVNPVGNSYDVTASYNAQIRASLILRAYPELFIELLFMRFDLPLGQLAWSPLSVNVPMDFNDWSVSIPVVAGEGEGEGEVEGEVGGEGEGEGEVEGEVGGEGEGEGESEGEVGGEGEGEGESEGEVGGEGEGEGETEGEGEVEEPLDPLACGKYDWSGTPTVIEDFVLAQFSVTIPDRGSVEDLAVWIDLYHLRIGDVNVWIESPAGTQVALLAQTGGDSAHMLDTTLWDSATEAVVNGSGPFGGLFRPVESLQAFDGENAQGTWTLNITDGQMHNKGILNGVSVLVNPCDLSEVSQDGGKEWHSSDVNPRNGQIDIGELLRAIQFFTFGEYACDSGGEDGYKPGLGWHHNCLPHDGDYNPANWNFSLSEVLRLVQLFNAGGYHKSVGSEDGFAPGLAP
jgi:subtilisin-like proprotein convertase family protein